MSGRDLTQTVVLSTVTWSTASIDQLRCCRFFAARFSQINTVNCFKKLFVYDDQDGRNFLLPYFSSPFLHTQDL